MPQLPQLQFRRYRVAERSTIASGVFRLVVEAVDPANTIPAFQAGQWVYLRLLNPDGSEWAKAAYSIASAPSAGTARIELGIKVAGEFTKRCERLAVGDEVELQGPWGVFVAKNDQPRHVLFAGGIGVTPFVSMVREAVAGTLPGEIILFYSNRLLKEASYLEELKRHAIVHASIKLVPVLTRETPPAWEGELGRIDLAMIERHVEDFAIGEYLSCGPREFMQAIRSALLARGVDPKRIHQELFG